MPHNSRRQEMAARAQTEEALRQASEADVRDSSGRERAEDQLGAAEAKLRSFIEAAPQAILAVDREGRIQLVNSRVEEMFGYHREELLGQQLEILLPERFRASHTGHRNGYFATPRVRPMGAGLDLAGRRKDGFEFPVEVGLSFVHWEEGDWALGLISDITERKRISDELARANLELRRSNAELEQFAYIASHDLQEPLRMVTSYLQLLERRYGNKLDSEAGEFIQYAVDGAVRMKALITALLDYSRSGTRDARREIISCQTIVETALQNLKTAIDESEALIEVRPLPRVTGDAVQLAQLFQNLIANAIKFRHGDIRIVISATQERGQWIFAVRDNGIGIDHRYSERIFQVFQRLHSADVYPGTGIGLAICKKIVERHGGRIWLESKPGEGSTFFFTIPVNEEAADDYPIQAVGHPSGRR